MLVKRVRWKHLLLHRLHIRLCVCHLHLKRTILLLSTLTCLASVVSLLRLNTLSKHRDLGRTIEHILRAIPSHTHIQEWLFRTLLLQMLLLRGLRSLRVVGLFLNLLMTLFRNLIEEVSSRRLWFIGKLWSYRLWMPILLQFLDVCLVVTFVINISHADYDLVFLVIPMRFFRQKFDRMHWRC